MFRRNTDEHLIDDGRVFCPLRERDVEFDLCAGCQWASSIDLKAKTPVVRCRPDSTPTWFMRPWL